MNVITEGRRMNFLKIGAGQLVNIEQIVAIMPPGFQNEKDWVLFMADDHIFHLSNEEAEKLLKVISIHAPAEGRNWWKGGHE